MKIRGPSTAEKIGEFEEEKEVKYLGIQLGGRGKDIFGAENKLWLEKAEKRQMNLKAKSRAAVTWW